MTETQVADRPVDSEAETQVGTRAAPRHRRGQVAALPDDTPGALPAQPATAMPPARNRTARGRAGLSTPAALRSAILAREILGPPKALRER